MQNFGKGDFLERRMIPRSKSQVRRLREQKGVIDKDSKKFHENVFKEEEEMDKFFKENPNAKGFEIYDFFRKLTEKKGEK